MGKNPQAAGSRLHAARWLSRENDVTSIETQEHINGLTAVVQRRLLGRRSREIVAVIVGRSVDQIVIRFRRLADSQEKAPLLPGRLIVSSKLLDFEGNDLDRYSSMTLHSFLPIALSRYTRGQKNAPSSSAAPHGPWSRHPGRQEDVDAVRLEDAAWPDLVRERQHAWKVPQI